MNEMHLVRVKGVQRRADYWCLPRQDSSCGIYNQGENHNRSTCKNVNQVL